MQHLRWSEWLETVVEICYIELCLKYESTTTSVNIAGFKQINAVWA